MNARRSELVRVGCSMALFAAVISVDAFVWPWLVPIGLAFLLFCALLACGEFFHHGRRSASEQYAAESLERSRQLAELLAKHAGEPIDIHIDGLRVATAFGRFDQPGNNRRK